MANDIWLEERTWEDDYLDEQDRRYDDMAYKYRNLPCTNNDFAVSGDDENTGWNGVLEWCPSLEDARQTMTLMEEEKGFSSLRIEHWKEDGRLILQNYYWLLEEEGELPRVFEIEAWTREEAMGKCTRWLGENRGMNEEHARERVMKSDFWDSSSAPGALHAFDPPTKL